MNPADPNVQQVQLVARALGPLREHLVLVGGCAAGLLITDSARPPVRATQDVDLIAEVASKIQYYRLGEELRQLGFTEDMGNVICRWRLGDLKVDVMPTSGDVLNFRNAWYADALKEAVPTILPDGASVLLISAPYFVATKLEAFYDRGKGDYMASHDIEDVINVIDGRPSIIDEIASQRGAVSAYLKSEIDELISDRAFLDSLPALFRPVTPEQERAPVVLARLRAIAGL
jgi:predicted nucleotidyltransferase